MQDLATGGEEEVKFILETRPISAKASVRHGGHRASGPRGFTRLKGSRFFGVYWGAVGLEAPGVLSVG